MYGCWTRPRGRATPAGARTWRRAPWRGRWRPSRRRRAGCASGTSDHSIVVAMAAGMIGRTARSRGPFRPAAVVPRRVDRPRVGYPGPGRARRGSRAWRGRRAASLPSGWCRARAAPRGAPPAAALGTWTPAPPRARSRTRSAGRAVQDHTAGAHHDDALERLRHEPHVVADRDHRPSGGPKVGHDPLDPLHAAGVLPGRRLVQHDDRRLHGQDRGQRRAASAASSPGRTGSWPPHRPGPPRPARSAPHGPAPRHAGPGSAPRTPPRSARCRRRSGGPGSGTPGRPSAASSATWTPVRPAAEQLARALRLGGAGR